MELYRYFPGSKPLLISVPHAGTYVPPAIAARLAERAKALPDTDWHVDRLYEFAQSLGAHMLIATHSRYVVDLNRGPDNASLYPGQFTTGLVPATFFDAAPLYTDTPPDDAEVARRVETYWKPYHAKIRDVLEGVRAQSSRAVLFDAHSICSRVPSLFAGQLPDLNLGTGGGSTAALELEEALLRVAKESSYSSVLNGRFKGGYITRHYGAPAQGISAVQLELAQYNYMNEQAPYAYDPVLAMKLQAVLGKMVTAMIGWAA